MARTRVPSEQLNFRSANTGTHLLDTYLEDAEKGGLTLAQLMGKLFDDATGNIDTFDFRYTNTPADGATPASQILELRIGTDADYQEIASFTQLFTDLASFKSTALADMEAKRQDAEDSKDAALASELDAEAAQAAAEAARDAAALARDNAQTYANQAFQTTPTVIQQGIILAQLHGDLFDGSTL
jgi:chemotaxis protein histidine kinase CheA